MFLSIFEPLPSASDAISKTLPAAMVAALGYVGKLLLNAWNEHQRNRRMRRKRLVEIQSLLQANKVSYGIQNQHAKTLLHMIMERAPAVDTSAGYEAVFSQAFPTMVPAEKELHLLIRSITINSLQPGNAALMKWLDQDDFFKGNYGRPRPFGPLADKLLQLQTHLTLWKAKFEMWISGRPEHALVYMVDEKNHGVGFPIGIEQDVAKSLSRLSRLV